MDSSTSFVPHCAQNDNVNATSNSQIPMKTIDIELLKSHPLPDWNDETHKAERGKLLLIGGSRHIPGAAILAARAALRSGCGSVRVAVPQSVALAIGIAVPELMVVPLPETKDGTISVEAMELIDEQIKVCDAIALGPGLDANSETDDFAREVVETAPLPLLIDAQAISALSSDWKAAARSRILTPHNGEFETLTGETPGEDREKMAMEYAKKAGATLALKGHQTIVATPEGDTYLEESGSRALGTAGSGDVLAGIIGSLLAQGLDATRATIWGVHLHAQAGEALTKDGPEDGLLASDFIGQLPTVQKYLRRSTTEKKAGGFGLRHG